MCALYVALGDSMSIDDYAGGPGRGAASLLYRNRDNDFPEWAGRDLASVGYERSINARDGALSTGVLNWQLERMPERPDLVTLTVGGNDLFINYGNNAAASDAVADALSTIEEVVTRLRDSVIVLTTVYDPSDGLGEIPGSRMPPWPDGVAILKVLNDGLRRLAAGYGLLLADVHSRFIGHGQSAGDPAQFEPQPANRDLWYCGVIEPNAWGSSEIRAAWWHTLVAAGVAKE